MTNREGKKINVPERVDLLKQWEQEDKKYYLVKIGNVTRREFSENQDDSLSFQVRTFPNWKIARLTKKLFLLQLNLLIALSQKRLTGKERMRLIVTK